MSPRLSVMLLIVLIASTAFAEGLDPVRIGRYSAIVPGPELEQADPFALPIHATFPRAIQTVGAALKHVLKDSGYRLAADRASCPSLPALLGLPLPAVHRRLGPMRLDEALKTLAGPAHTLVIDPLHRLVSFELKASYRALVADQRRAIRSSQSQIERMTATPRPPLPVQPRSKPEHALTKTYKHSTLPGTIR